MAIVPGGGDGGGSASRFGSFRHIKCQKPAVLSRNHVCVRDQMKWKPEGVKQITASHPASVCPNGVPSGIRGLGELFCYSYYAVATILLHLFAILPLVIADLNYCWKP
uniref:Uncharacterized protein n=1 Tax=Anopheles quadriannulatus TaxID=34691 RepID=A0A182X734_ANOQN